MRRSSSRAEPRGSPASSVKPTLGAKTCLWCNVDGFDLDVRNALVWGNTSVADTASGVIAFGVAPLTAFVTLALASNHEGAYCKDFWSDALIVGEATVLAMELQPDHEVRRPARAPVRV